MKKNILRGITLISLALASSSAYLEANKGQQLYNTCVACHMPNGAGNMALKSPAIAGQEPWYLEKQLSNFKNGIRGTHPKDMEGAMMAPMAKSLASDADIKAVSQYISKMAPVAPVHNQGGDAVKGKALYGTCLACHGDKGQGNQAMQTPALKGMSDWYIVAQLKKFKEGIRGSNSKDVAGAMMAPMAKTLVDEQAMKDVAAYIATFE